MEPSLASIESYDARAAEFCAAYESVSTPDLFPAMLDLFPVGADVLDVGAGSGRDAAHLARAGNVVLAAEPSRGMREEGMRRHRSGVTWLEDSLPRLAEVRRLGRTFDFILVGGVWMHVHPSERPEAMATLRGLLASGGTLVMTLRLGPAEPERAMFPLCPEEVRRHAEAAGLEVFREDLSVDRLGRRALSWHALALRPGMVSQ